MDNVLAESVLKMLEKNGIHVVQEEDVAAWKRAKEGNEFETERMTKDALLLYLRQMGRGNRMQPEEEEGAFKAIEEAQTVVRDLFCCFSFAPKMFSRFFE